MIEQECSACLGSQENEFITPEGHTVVERCPYCVTSWAYATLRRPVSPQDSLAIAIQAALKVLQRAPALVKSAPGGR
jgi:hypothetical protein